MAALEAGTAPKRDTTREEHPDWRFCTNQTPGQKSRRRWSEGQFSHPHLDGWTPLDVATGQPLAACGASVSTPTTPVRCQQPCRRQRRPTELLGLLERFSDSLGATSDLDPQAPDAHASVAIRIGMGQLTHPPSTPGDDLYGVPNSTIITPTINQRASLCSTSLAGEQ